MNEDKRHNMIISPLEYTFDRMTYSWWKNRTIVMKIKDIVLGKLHHEMKNL